jgi:hypothetical protein
MLLKTAIKQSTVDIEKLKDVDPTSSPCTYFLLKLQVHKNTRAEEYKEKVSNYRG